MRRVSHAKHPARRNFLPTSAPIALVSAISLIVACGTADAKRRGSSAATNAHALRASTASATGNHAELSNLSDGELESYLKVTDVLRVPFDSTIATIKTCLRQPEIKIEPCLDAGSKNQACKTSVPQCATAAEQAWEVYIAHYLRLFQTKAPKLLPADSQRAWKAYVDAECSFESSIYPDDAVMRVTVVTTCMEMKAQQRALELRGSLINAEI